MEATTVILRSGVGQGRTERRRISMYPQAPRLHVPRDSSLPLVAQNDREEADAASFRARCCHKRRRYFEMV